MLGTDYIAGYNKKDQNGFMGKTQVGRNKLQGKSTGTKELVDQKVCERDSGRAQTP